VEDGLYQILTRDDDGGEGKNASVRIDLTAGDTIWIRIGAYGNHGTGDYDFIIADGKTRTTWNWIVPAAARISGAAGTRWVTDLVIRNQGSTPADAMMEYWPQEGIQPTPIPISIQPGAVMKIDNVIEDRFQLLESAGAIRVSSNQPILVSSRTYNLLEEGTYGQAIPGQREEDALLEGERGYLIGLAESDTHRTNLGFVNPLSSDSTVRITMYDTTGNPIGSSRSWTLSGHSFVQIDHVLEQFGTPPIEEARAEVEILSGAVFSYISIVDQKTGDPVYRPVQRALGATRGLPGVSRAPGEAGTLWRTELWILSTSSYEQEAILKFLPRQGESGYEDLPLIIQPGAMIHVNDALNEISHIAEGSGTYVLETGPEVLVTGRTYTEKEIGTYGQGLVSLRPDLAISGENAGYLIMGEETEKSRSNLGLINPGQDPVDITLQGISPDGTTLLSHQWTIEGESSVQVDHILTLFSQNDLGSATIRISISDPDRGGSIWAWLSVVDQVTGDAVFEEAVVESMGPPPQNRTLLSPVSKRPHQPRILGTLP